ncbi:MAG: bifunctional phosphopantothenoylcysteine decarboxylase/phosphopantothenate--cysteine ligase CoaBC [Chitinophagales bacterium]
MSLQGKKILLGVCGGIAAYKCAYLTRLLIKEGAEVKIIMTPDAKAFVGPVTFSTLSKNPVIIDFFNADTGAWNNHVSAGMWADVFVIAPATANTIAKMAVGISDNFLLAAYLSSRSTVIVAPAMDLDMWQHNTTRKNIQKLKDGENIIIGPESGELASGLIGDGRMAEPENILFELKKYFSGSEKKLAGKKVLITAGPTHEAIDPVRFIGNNSSGKMGFALAEILAEQGATVTLIHGPVSIRSNDNSIHAIAVTSAEEMFNSAEQYFSSTDILIAAAAVADFTPDKTTHQKIKKSEINSKGIDLHLKPTVDILKTLSGKKKPGQVMIGFALETDNEAENARKKLVEKGLDFIVLNSTRDKGAGFQHDTNKISILDKNNNVVNFELKPKKEVAKDIVDYLIKYLHA